MRILHPAATLFLLTVAPLHAEGVGTAFTYQGLLERPAGTLVQDVCAFSFSLCDAEDGACTPGTVSSHPAVSVAFGVFTVPDVDFGPGSITGQARWMEIAVKCTGDADFATLAPRVELKPAPYSVRAVEGVGPPTGIHVTPDGTVGIGTNAPQAQLDVNGAARATTMEITGGTPLTPAGIGWGNNAYGQTEFPFDAVSIVAGNWHNLAIRSDGSLVGWGVNADGQTNVPDGRFISIAAGAEHSLGIREDRTLAGWGQNQYGQVNVPSGEFVAIAAGTDHSLAIRLDGTLVGWGANFFGEISVPAGTFVAVAAGGGFSIGLRTDGTLVGWGYNAQGQSMAPTGIFTSIASGNDHSLAIRDDGSIEGWGFNGDGRGEDQIGVFVAVAAGSHSLAIRSDGTLLGWGGNNHGQISVPDGAFAAIGAGREHSIAVLSEPPSRIPGLRLQSDNAVKPGSNTWTIFSDRRLKKDITPLDGALDRLLQLQGVTFHWRDPASQGGITGLQMGLIADEVQRVFPQWVGRDPKGYQTLTVGGFEALTAEAMRELRDEKDCEIENLKSEISELKEMVKELVEGIEKSKSPNVQKSKQGNEAARQEGNEATRQGGNRTAGQQRDEKGGGQ